MTTSPAWGTPPTVEGPAVSEFVVIGFYGSTLQTFLMRVTATGGKAAEDAVMADLVPQRDENGVEADPRVVEVVTVVDGQIQSARTYAASINPETEG